MDRPNFISTHGNHHLLGGKMIAFTGSRDASPRALAATAQCVRESVAKGYTVVSGGARGIDRCAHKTALEAGGNTIVVIAQGINSYNLPAELQNSWDSQRALIVSQFFPSASWTTPNALERNKTIVNLGQRLVVGQVASRGGTMQGARYALHKGKSVFVIEYRDPSISPGSQSLFASGATPVRNLGNRTSLWSSN